MRCIVKKVISKEEAEAFVLKLLAVLLKSALNKQTLKAA